MSARLRYEECAPPPAFRAWIACCWQIRGAQHRAGGAHRVLPDGCADLIVDVNGWRAAGTAPEFVGPMTAAALVPLAGAVDVFGVRFLPGAAGTLLRGSMRELVGLAVAPTDVGLRIALPLQRLAATGVLRQRARLVLAALAPILRSAATPDPAVAHALERWCGPAPGASARGASSRDASAPQAPAAALPRVAALARDLGLSERTFERRFAARVGYAPSQFRKLVRFRRLLALHAGGARDWVALALDAGYADQPHLVRDFRAFAGVSPTAWVAETTGVGIVQDADVRLE